MEHAYTGNIGWIDLTTGTSSIETLNENVARKYLGGKGLGAYLLYRYLKPGIDPLDRENLLIFVTGPLTGTNFPAVSRSGVVTKSPLTGTFLDSYSGGFFGTQLKWAGFDALVIQGKSERPCYLTVENGAIDIHDAGHLWGLSTSETENRLKAALSGAKKETVSIAAIGQAGENLVRFANIINERRAHGRGGAGAVMGSKHLKALVVKGGLKPSQADEDRYRQIRKRCIEKIGNHPSVGKGGVFNRFGTMPTITLIHGAGALPARNWQENTYDHTEKIDADAFFGHQKRTVSCFSCPIGCSRETTATVDGENYTTEGPDYETMFAFGPNCEVSDPAVIIAADRLCDDYGMDTISCGGVIGFAMECAERGVLPKAIQEDLHLAFGDGTSLIRAIHAIGARTGSGAWLAQGVRRLSEKLAGTSDFAMHVKGMELPGYDPRSMKGQGLTYAVSDRGGCHVRSNTLRTEIMGLGLDKPLDRYAYEEKAAMVAKLQREYAACDCIIACLFGSMAISMADYAAAIAAVTGWDFQEDELLTAAERAWNLSRMFNVREGLDRRHDTLPQRLFKDPSSKGPSQGQVVERKAFEAMLDDYYRRVGWDPASGKPTPEKLKALGIDGLTEG